MSGANTMEKQTEKLPAEAHGKAWTPQRRPPSFILLYHRDGMAAVHLLPDLTVRVGRGSPPQLSDPSLSRVHASFTLRSDTVQVEDLESTNGIFVRGERVPRADLRHGEEVLLGNVVASIHMGSVGEPAIPSVESHERFMARLEEEVVRATLLGRSLAVLLVQAAPNKQLHVRKFHPAIATKLRPIDSIGLYSASTAEILLPEIDRANAERVAGDLSRAQTADDAGLRVGAAVFDRGKGAQELLERARKGLFRTTAERPMVFEPSAGSSADFAHSQGSPTPVFVSSAMREVLDAANRVAKGNISVLIVGETGTGKDVIAKCIHDHSPRKKGPLVVVNCAAIPPSLVEATLFGSEKGAFTGADRRRPGLFEAACGGTLVLDEVGDLPLAVQPILLRALESRHIRRVGATSETEVDVRVVASTNAELSQMMEAGTFRKDLYFRLSAMMIPIPPLRARVEDMDALLDHFLERASIENSVPRCTLDPTVKPMLRAYAWPGNVRELFNAVARAVVVARSNIVTAEDFPELVRGGFAAPDPPTSATLPGSPSATPVQLPGAGLRERIRKMEEEMIVEALRQTNGNQKEAAALLLLPLRTLTHKIKAYHIRRPSY